MEARTCLERRRYDRYTGGETVTMALMWCGDEWVAQEEEPPPMSPSDQLTKACKKCMKEKAKHSE